MDKMFFLTGVLTGFGALLSQIPVFAEAPEIDRLMIPPYRHYAVIDSYGVRSVCATAPDELEVEIGLSHGNSYANLDSYRIVSVDDPRYSGYEFKRAVSGNVRLIQEAKGMPGSILNRFCRVQVRLKLPEPMEEGREYSVNAVEYQGYPMTYGRDWASFVYRKSGIRACLRRDQADERSLRVLGLRGIVPVGGGVIQVSFGPATAPETLRDLRNYQLTRNGEAVVPELISVRPAIDAWIPNRHLFRPIPRYDVFLKLPGTLRNGDRLSLFMADHVTGGQRDAGLTFSDRRTVSPSFHTDRYGYLVSAPVKEAYLTCWFGRLPGVAGGALGLPMNLPGIPHLSLILSNPPPEFQLLRSNTGAESETVMTGRLAVVPFPAGLQGPSVLNLPGVHVYRMDFSNVKEEGMYFLSVPGVGRSLSFKIRNEHFSDASQLPGLRQFIKLGNGIYSASRYAVQGGKPWFTNLWTYNPYHPELKEIDRVNPEGETPPPDGLDFGKAPIQIGGKPWYAHLWTYDPYDPRQQEIAQRHLPGISLPDYASHWIPPVQQGEKPWYAHVWSSDPYTLEKQESWKSILKLIPPSEPNQWNPEEKPFYESLIRGYQTRCVSEEQELCPLAHPRLADQQYAP